MAFISKFNLQSSELSVIIATLILIFLVRVIFSRPWNPSKLPLVNGKKWYELGYGGVEKRFNADTKGLCQSGFQRGRQKSPDGFYLLTASRPTLVLPPKYADILRNDSRLSLSRVTAAEFHENLPLFEPLSYIVSDGRVIPKVITHKITRSLTSLIPRISSETEHALQRVWKNEADWHQISLRTSLDQIMAQIQSRVFLDDELCRDPSWLQITIDITKTLFLAARALRGWPDFMKPYLAHILPLCRKATAELNEAERLLEPLVAKRRAALTSDIESDSDRLNTIDWFLDASHESVLNIAYLQLGLSVVALETTTEAVYNVLTDISSHPKAIHDLRAEIRGVIGKMGLNTSSIQKLELMDSVIKESQRMSPLGYFGMQRKALDKIILPDGMIIPKNTFLTVSTLHMLDSSVWPNGEEYDPYRFYNMGVNGEKTPSNKFIHTSSNHMGFGHGKEACPGRFLAVNLIKTILCHILVKYDFEVTGQEEYRREARGYNLIANQKLEINLKRHYEDFEL
ncbi:hypothetical protein N7456_007331 [Penicillium angulare]|uniref:Cytochrome P450 n=1 Tax=Penicillium angulare TaxID=116970 RepID=A0A9W9FAQ9_9EURO|nr:hypothetical protein N7456_007331 [Penicillium angulare]